MFCVLTVEDRDKLFCEKMLKRTRRDEYLLVSVPVISGAPFYRLTAKVGKKGVDYDRIVFEVGRCAQRLLVPKNVILPKNRKGIGEFNSCLLYNKIADNTADYLLEKIGKDAYCREKGIIKHNGRTIKIGENPNDFFLPQIYSSLMPDGIEKYRFASALYELCGVFSIGECRFNSVTVNGEKKSIDSLDI